MIGVPANDITAYGHLIVRRAVQRDDWISDTIFELAAQGRSDWSQQDWDTLLAELDSCNDKLADWLILY